MRASLSSRARTARVRAEAQPGAKVEKWLKTPFDVAAFGPRATFGALVSLPERLQMMQTDIAKFTELVQSPRPVDEKQQLVLQEVEDTLVEFLRRGAGLETDVLSSLKSALPQELAQQLDAVIPPLPDDAGGAAGGGAGGGSGASGAYGVVAEEPPAVVYTADAVADSQIASEMTEIRVAVSGVKLALEGLRSNSDPSRGGMLRLNLREARDMLSRRLREATVPAAAAGDAAAGSLAAARREAQVLLEEVDGQFFAAN